MAVSKAKKWRSYLFSEKQPKRTAAAKQKRSGYKAKQIRRWFCFTKHSVANFRTAGFSQGKARSRVIEWYGQRELNPQPSDP